PFPSRPSVPSPTQAGTGTAAVRGPPAGHAATDPTQATISDVTDPQPDPLTLAAELLTIAGDKEPGQAITARNDVMRAQVYALLSIAESLATLAVNTTPTPPAPPVEPPTDEPTSPPETEPPTDAELPG
ncbi:MAG: hypothetical protein JWM31_3435, partial [Solirubrobacterales bacterium]|nr:hypothetical protein [Solirubrobacterales bacterium]